MSSSASPRKIACGSCSQSKGKCVNNGGLPCERYVNDGKENDSRFDRQINRSAHWLPGSSGIPSLAAQPLGQSLSQAPIAQAPVSQAPAIQGPVTPTPGVQIPISVLAPTSMVVLPVTLTAATHTPATQPSNQQAREHGDDHP
jgi:hypothetical protein